MMKRLLALALLLAAGCPQAPAPPPPLPAPVAPVASGTPFASVTQLVPLDAVDPLSLPSEVAKTVEAARAKVPELLDDEERRALEDLESRFERDEAALESPKDRARLLGAYYWERLRIFSPELAAEPPVEVLSAFERGTARGD